MTNTAIPTSSGRETLDSVVIRFAGDSGDGMQVTGSQFTQATALFGNDLATFPDFPAEIRAPTGTINGVGNYEFMLTDIDGVIPGGGGIDKFRLKIWDKESDNIIYDNMLGMFDGIVSNSAVEHLDDTIGTWLYFNKLLKLYTTSIFK